MSDITISDKEIASLMQETKQLPDDYENIFQTKAKSGHNEKEISIPRGDGSQFKVILRQNQINALDFSLILGYVPAKKTGIFRLRRYNGKSHPHTNRIEKQSFYDFHIHQATERYQRAGFDEDAYAEPYPGYANVQDALDCMVKDCAIKLPANRQLKLI